MGSVLHHRDESRCFLLPLGEKLVASLRGSAAKRFRLEIRTHVERIVEQIANPREVNLAAGSRQCRDQSIKDVGRREKGVGCLPLCREVKSKRWLTVVGEQDALDFGEEAW